MTVDIISLPLSMNVWDLAGIKVATPDQQSDSLLILLRGQAQYMLRVELSHFFEKLLINIESDGESNQPK